ncbi:hypothetical protein KEM52_003770 [Ascosphaera acerosa]|nr:hypothetical protein KEM52_003770 [Ascosphaera acerosa]
MLEDESGRIRLVGSVIEQATLVTGAIIAVLGTENGNGDFEVFDMRVPDLAPQPGRWATTAAPPLHSKNKSSPPRRRKKIALLSGLEINGSGSDTTALALLRDYLLDAGAAVCPSPAQITRLIIAGNSIGADAIHHVAAADTTRPSLDPPKSRFRRKFRYDPASFNASPITQLDDFLAELLPSLPITLLPGPADPANYTLPQQGVHRAMLPRAKSYCADDPADPAGGWLDNTTNPWEGEVDGWRVWACSGQNVDDVMRYLDFGEEGDSGAEARMRAMEALLRLRTVAPSAPDTLFCYPYQDKDPFTLEESPHVFLIGNQPATLCKTITFRPAPANAAIEGLSLGDDVAADDDGDGDDGKTVRVKMITLSKFSETGEVLLLDAETLEAEVVRFEVREPRDPTSALDGGGCRDVQSEYGDGCTKPERAGRLLLASQL